MDKLAKQFKSPLVNFHTGRSIPQIGLGTYQMSPDQCLSAVETAIKIGYRHIDTASIYKNEEAIGKCLDKLYSDKLVTRQDLFITSKISPYEQGYENALQAGNNILKRLNTDYLDLLIIHWPGVSKVNDSNEIPKIRLQTWKALEKLQSEGKVKDIGVSNFLPRHLDHLLTNSQTVPVLNQFEIHPFCINHELIDYCNEKKIVVEAYSSLARKEDILMKDPLLTKLAQKYQKTVAQVALKWALQMGWVILPKSVTPKYIQENIDLLDFELTSEEMKSITALNKNYHTCWDPSTVIN